MLDRQSDRGLIVSNVTDRAARRLQDDPNTTLVFEEWVIDGLPSLIFGNSEVEKVMLYVEAEEANVLNHPAFRTRVARAKLILEAARKRAGLPAEDDTAA